MRARGSGSSKGLPVLNWAGCLVALLLVVAAISALPPPARAQWWKEPALSSPLDQRVLDPSGRGVARVKWDDGYLEVRAGATADRRVALNAAHARSLALTAARHLAYLKLAEVVEGVSVDGLTVVKNAMVESQAVRTRVSARIKGAVVVSEDARELADGGVWADVVVGLRLSGPGSVAESLAPWLISRPAEVFAGNAAARVSEQYTGLIVEVSEAGFSPALAPRLLEEGSGKVVFGPHLVQLAALAQHGPVGYVPALADSRTQARAGTNPLVVRALATAGARKGDVLISRRDADRILAADRDGAFLARGAVVLVLGRDRQALLADSGRRWALVIGVDDYPRGGPGALPRLSYAERDARALASVLVQRGGVTPDGMTLLEGRVVTRERVIEALRDLRSRAREEDSVVVYFSGHGSVGTGEDGRPHYFLVPGDGQLSDLVRTAVSDDLFEELIGQLPARQVLVILDTCYAGGGGGAIRARGSGPVGGPVPAARSLIEATAGRVVMAASKPEQLAFEDDGRGGGVFTSFLIEGLQGPADLDRDGAISALELFQFVSVRVRDYSRQRFQTEQTPVLEARGLAGEFVVARRP